MSKREVSTEYTGWLRHVRPPDVLHVDVVDAIREALDERHIVYALIAEMAGVIVESEGLSATNGFERALRGRDVEGDFRRVDFECKTDTDFIEDIENRVPALREVVVA